MPSESRGPVKGNPGLAEVKDHLDGLALELLRGRFPNVDVEPYYRVAETYIGETMKRDKGIKRNMRGNSPLETLILLSMDTVVSAYVLISGKRNEEKVNGLLKDYETMVGDYLKSIGLLTY